MNNTIVVIEQELYKLFFKANNPRNDGYNQWNNKQKLIDIKFLVDTLLEKTSSFGILEEDYIKTKEQEKLVEILKK